MLPRVIVYNLISLDGRIDGFEPDMGLFYELAQTWHEQATLCGADTILAAEAMDSVPAEQPSDFAPRERIEGDTRPILVICDSRGRVRNWHYWRNQPYWRDVMALCTQNTPEEYLDYLLTHRIDYIMAGEERVDLRVALEELNSRCLVDTVRVDSGGALSSALLGARLVNELSVLIAPVVAGSGVRSFIRLAEHPVSLKLIEARTERNDHVWLRYDVLNPEPDSK